MTIRQGWYNSMQTHRWTKRKSLEYLMNKLIQRNFVFCTIVNMYCAEQYSVLDGNIIRPYDLKSMMRKNDQNLHKKEKCMLKVQKIEN